MTTETATFQAVIDAGIANRSLDDLRSRVLNLGGALPKLNEGLEHLGGRTSAQVEKGLRSVGAAFGGTASKASEMLGLVADVSDVLAGGALAAAFTVGALAVSKIAEAYQDAAAGAAAFREAIDAQIELIPNRHAAMLDAFSERIKALNDRAKDLTQTMKGLSTGDAVVGDVRTQIENLNIGLAAIRSQRDRLREVSTGDARPFAAGDSLPDARSTAGPDAGQRAAIIRNLDAKEKELLATLKTLDAQLKGAAEATEKIKSLEVGANLQAFAKNLRAGETPFGPTSTPFGPAEDAEARARRLGNGADLATTGTEDEIAAFFAAQKALREDDIANRKAYADAIHALDVRMADERDKNNAEELLKQQEKIKENAQLAGQAAAQATGIVVGAAQEFLDATIKGQDDALAHATITLFKAAGQALISQGIQLAGQAVVSALTPGLQGAAAAQGGGAAALIGGGLALGGIGSGLEAGLLGRTSSGGAEVGGFGGGVTTGAGAGVAGAGGGITVQVVYGLGPSPEKMARDLSQAIDDARARRFLRGRR